MCFDFVLLFVARIYINCTKVIHVDLALDTYNLIYYIAFMLYLYIL